jgi:hypothetical protein
MGVFIPRNPAVKNLSALKYTLSIIHSYRQAQSDTGRFKRVIVLDRLFEGHQVFGQQLFLAQETPVRSKGISHGTLREAPLLSSSALLKQYSLSWRRAPKRLRPRFEDTPAGAEEHVSRFLASGALSLLLGAKFVLQYSSSL